MMSIAKRSATPAIAKLALMMLRLMLPISKPFSFSKTIHLTA